MTSALDDSLTVPQQTAARHVDGPLLILAGPGSGKTRVVTHRIAHLLRHGVPARNILALTFTNKAADEMRGRVAELASARGVWISTFHRFCARLLREHAALVGLGENFTIYDTSDSQRALRHALEGMDDLNLGQVSPTKLLQAISRCKNELISAEAYQPISREPTAVLLGDVYPAYQRQLRQANAVDFDDLLLYTVDLLRENEPLRQELDARYRYVMVDEYQDTNLAQYAIVRALSIDHPNLAVTGDPDQSIYSWRGANIRNILEFERDYPRVTVVRLEHNFRSTPEILHVADHLIRHNRRRKKKSLIPYQSPGQQVRLLAFPSQWDEANFLADDIAAQVAAGERRYRDFAIFYRINALSRYLEQTLRQQGIPYQILNGVEFYQRKEIKDVMAYLQLLNNPQDDMALLRVINTPPRGLGKVTLGRLADAARTGRTSLWEAARAAASLPALGNKAKRSLAKFVDLIVQLQSLATAPVETILRHALEQSEYEPWLREQDERADEDRCANLGELLGVARQFDMSHAGNDYLDAFLEQSSLVSDTDAWEDQHDKVTMMTLHSAKGLEFPAVYLVALEEGKLPHERCRDDPDQLEEERRLLFVGLTRAQQRATISFAKYREYRGRTAPTVPSQFLMELPRDEMDVVMPEAKATDYPASWDDFDEALDFDPSEFDPSDVAEPDPALAAESPTSADTEVPIEPRTAKRAAPLLSSLTTAASLAGREAAAKSETAADETGPVAPTDPDVFTLGMRVQHPKYGLGKIVTLHGSGANRSANVNFVTAGEKTFVLAKCKLRPLK